MFTIQYQEHKIKNQAVFELLFRPAHTGLIVGITSGNTTKIVLSISLRGKL